MKLGIDIGGTFTDLVLIDEITGKVDFGKTLTTYPDPTQGILNGVRDILDQTGIDRTRIDTIVHGTTLVTNAVIERKGARTGFITTRGFEDVLEIGRELRYDIYDLFLTVPKPLVPRNLRKGVTERMDKSGAVLEPLSELETLEIIKELVDQGVQSIGVCLINAYANPAHERQIGAWIKDHYPQIYFSLSSDIMPEIREYERSSATAMNAYVQPITKEYLSRLQEQLEAIGIESTILIMVSSGKLTTLEGAQQSPVQLLESGPAGGAMAAVFFGKLCGTSDLLAFDMGGTTAKACIIKSFEPEITNQFEAARVRRFKKGSGLPVRIPVIDLIEIGAGGGSIARVSELGLLTVGPDSAASDPGPASYGLGGKQPTVTDADLVLGYLDPSYFLGGTMRLDKEAAKEAIFTHIAQPLGISIEEAAMGIHRIVNENMANAARVHIIEKGFDPRGFDMIAFGGAGPVHAFNVARLLRSKRLIIPVGAGVTSALGFLVSPVANEQIMSYVTTLDKIDWSYANSILSAMEKVGQAFLSESDISPSLHVVRRSVDMRYKGQGHEISVQFPNGALSADNIPGIIEAFENEYRLRYGRIIDGMAIEAVTWRSILSGPTPELTLYQIPVNTQPNALKGKREVFFPEYPAPFEVPVFERTLLIPGFTIDGPAIIEEKESTLIIGPDCQLIVDVYKNLIVEMYYPDQKSPIEDNHFVQEPKSIHQ
jgi:N-methylhydantoinase A